MSLLIYCDLSGIWVSPHFTIWCVVKVCGEGSIVVLCCMAGTEATMAIRGRLSRAHVSGWVLQSCLQCFLRPRHATFNSTKTHMAYYSMQGIGISPIFSCSFFFFFALFAAILSLAEHNLFSFVFVYLFSCLSSSLSFCNKPLGSFSFFNFCLCSFVSLKKKSRLLFLSVSLFSCRFVTHQTFLFVCLGESLSPLWL